MKKIITAYGLAAGCVVIGAMIGGQVLAGEGAGSSHWLGYLIMIVALSVIFVGIKRYRDRDLGGVIKFGTAVLLGLGITVLAGLVYVVVWEVYLSMTDYAFIEDYTQSILEARRAEGLQGEELEAVITQMRELEDRYANPLFRLPMTFLEIFPVGLLISLVSAGLLRNNKVLPART